MTDGAYDVVIVGAGAAGCAAAMNLPPGARALLVDRGDPAEGRCCGGLLAPDAQAAVRALGLALPEEVCVLPEPHVVCVHDLDCDHEQTYRRQYRNLNRARFDAWLLELAAQRVEVRTHTRFVAMETAGDPAAAGEVTVRLAGKGREETVRARLVIGAEGAGSLVRRAVFPGRPGPETMLAIQVRLATDSPPGEHHVLFASRLTDYYAWTIPKPGEVLVGAAFGQARGARERFAEVLGWFRKRLASSGTLLETSARRLSRPRSRNELFPGNRTVLLAGEAAGLVSPSSGEGLSFALSSGAAAGRAVGTPNPAAAYARGFGPCARRVTMKFLKARVIFSPALRRIALRVPWCP